MALPAAAFPAADRSMCIRPPAFTHQRIDIQFIVAIQATNHTLQINILYGRCNIQDSYFIQGSPLCMESSFYIYPEDATQSTYEITTKLKRSISHSQN